MQVFTYTITSNQPTKYNYHIAYTITTIATLYNNHPPNI